MSDTGDAENVTIVVQNGSTDHDDSKSNLSSNDEPSDVFSDDFEPDDIVKPTGDSYIPMQMSTSVMKVLAVKNIASKWRQKAKQRSLNMAFSEEPVQFSDSCHSMYWTKNKIVPLKNYHSEARAMKDIERFLEKPVVLFNPRSTKWPDIAKNLIEEMTRNGAKINKTIALKSIVNEDSDIDIPERIHGLLKSDVEDSVTDQGFVTVLSSTNAVTDTFVAFCVFSPKINMGDGMEEMRILCLVLSPTKEKHTKSAIEVGRTYSTLLADRTLQRALQNTSTSSDFAAVIGQECARVHLDHHENYRKLKEEESTTQMAVKRTVLKTLTARYLPPGRHLMNDIKRRGKWYLSDFTDGFGSWASIQKMITAIFFLYFSLLLPGIALGVLNDENTHGAIDARKVILSQAFGGLCFSLIGGQPLGVVRTTIPVVLFTKVIYNFAVKVFHVDFLTFYAISGISNALFLSIYSLSGASKIMSYCSRSTEEIVGIFISLAFIVNSMQYVSKEFQKYWCFPYDGVNCDVSAPLASFILVFGTLYIGIEIYNFKYSPYLSSGKRALVADYALVVAVLVMSFVGSYAFDGIKLGIFQDNAAIKTPFHFETFRFDAHNVTADGQTKVISAITFEVVLVSIALGFILSILFFVEGNVATSMVNSPRNRLKKGSAYHLDLLVVALINIVMSLFGLPWVHPALPHSPLHAKALADLEEKIEYGHVKQVIVSVIETRITNLVAHILIFISLLMVPLPLQYIPTPVLYGLLLFLGISSLEEFQMWERILLLFTEQNQYPPHHYIRKVPQKVVHTFTGLQLVQLAVLCGLSFSGVSYLKMFFPFVIIALLPVRTLLIPKFIGESHLEALDGAH